MRVDQERSDTKGTARLLYVFGLWSKLLPFACSSMYRGKKYWNFLSISPHVGLTRIPFFSYPFFREEYISRHCNDGSDDDVPVTTIWKTRHALFLFPVRGIRRRGSKKDLKKRGNLGGNILRSWKWEVHYLIGYKHERVKVDAWLATGMYFV